MHYRCFIFILDPHNNYMRQILPFLLSILQVRRLKLSEIKSPLPKTTRLRRAETRLQAPPSLTPRTHAVSPLFPPHMPLISSASLKAMGFLMKRALYISAAFGCRENCRRFWNELKKLLDISQCNSEGSGDCIGLVSDGIQLMIAVNIDQFFLFYFHL